MNNKLLRFSTAACLLLGSFSQVSAQASLSDEDYDKALWMSTRFYGGQRATDINKTEQQHNWLIQDYLADGVDASKTGISFAQDSDNGHDLSGGWFDCGDHVFFGQTGFYAGYVLLKAYDAFPEGFEDYYGEDYQGYRTAGDYSWEGAKGTPNGIPDILDEVKHQIDFFIKASKSSTEFYYEKGNGDYDHKERVTSVKMQTNSIQNGGELRPMWKDPSGASMASMCGASLAAMSRLYRPFDEDYADLCLVHAGYAFDYASANTGSAAGPAVGTFYKANSRWQNGWAILQAELYLATGQTSYKTTALALNTSDGFSNADVQPNAYYTFDYDNTGELALYALSEIGHPDAESDFYSIIEKGFIDESNYNSEGIYTTQGADWGKMRYTGNAAFVVALYDKMKGNTTLTDRVYDNIDYILGKNSGNQSYLAGFEPNSLSNVKVPTQIHHRNAYLYDGNDNDATIQLPTKNEQIGALVGGSRDGSYSNQWDDYVNTEVCVDYNVGFVGALAAIKEKKEPVDTTKFFTQCSSPSLGDDQSLCGLTSITLDANLAPNNIRTYEWFKDGVSQGSANKNNDTKTITQGGTWTVVVDSLGECSRTDVIIIEDVLPTIDLGEDQVLCTTSNVDLDAGISGAAINYVWSKDGSTILDETSQTLNVDSEGTYELTISATGCSSQSDDIEVTTQLPETVDATFCPGSTAQLEVLSTGGPYQWYTEETGGTYVYEGDIFEVTPTEEVETYYVKDAGSFETNIGPSSISGTATNWGEKGYSDNFWVEFDLSEDFTVESVKMPYSKIHSTHSGVVEIEIRDTDGNLMGSFESDSQDFTNTDGADLIEFTFNDFNVSSDWGPTLRMSLNTNGTTIDGQLNWDKGGTFSFPYSTQSGGVSLTSVNSGGQSGNNYIYFYDWKISSGTDCARKPVTATEDCTVGTDDNLEIELATLYPNPAQNSATLKANSNNGAIVKVFTLSGELVDEKILDDQITIGSNLFSGVYLVEILKDHQLQTIKFIKE